MSGNDKNCPFCGSDQLRTRGDDKVVANCCENCGATGPNEYSSVATWNDRRGDQTVLKKLDDLPYDETIILMYENGSTEDCFWYDETKEEFLGWRRRYMKVRGPLIGWFRSGDVK